MKKRSIILAMFLLILIYFLLLRPIFTGNLIEGTEQSYTKTICNQMACESYQITCKGKKLIGFAFTGNIIENKEHPINLIDKNNLCD